MGPGMDAPGIQISRDRLLERLINIDIHIKKRERKREINCTSAILPFFKNIRFRIRLSTGGNLQIWIHIVILGSINFDIFY